MPSTRPKKTKLAAKRKQARPAAGHGLPKSYLIMLPARSNHCFGCGPSNRDGLRLRFYDEGLGDRAICRVSVPKRFEGPPGHVHGGIIATLLDEAMGKANKLAGVVAMTRTMEIDYLRPVPLQTPLLLEGWGTRREGRKHWNAAEIRRESGEVLARGTGLFIAIDAERMLAALAAQSHSKAAKRKPRIASK